MTAAGRALAAIALSLIAASAAQAQSVADFYRGKTISFVIGVGPGGGYDSSPAMGLAMEPGGVDGNGSASWDYLETKPDWLAPRKVTFLYTIALDRYRAIPDVPTILELAGKGRDRDVLKLIASGSTIGRSIVGPPDIPPDRVAALRQAFDAMVQDAEFLADARNRHLGVDPMPGAELARIVADVATAPDDTVEKMKQVTRERSEEGLFSLH